MTDDMDSAGAAGPSFTAFVGTRRVASGALVDVAVAAQRAQAQDPNAAPLIFDRATGRVVDTDLRGAGKDIIARLSPPAGAAKRGRPKLGVVAREITLLPRHWDWLAQQPGGASVALRRLVEAARKVDAGSGDTRLRTEAAYRFMAAVAGDLPGFEEATRALFGGDRAGLETRMSHWPPDIKDEALRFVDHRSDQNSAK